MRTVMPFCKSNSLFTPWRRKIVRRFSPADSYLSQNTGTNFRSFGIEGNGDRTKCIGSASQFLRLTNVVNTLLMILKREERVDNRFIPIRFYFVGAVRKVQSRDVHAGIDHFRQHFDTLRWRSYGRRENGVPIASIVVSLPNVQIILVWRVFHLKETKRRCLRHENVVNLRFRVDVEQSSLFEGIDRRFSEGLMLVEGSAARLLLFQFVLEFATDVHLNTERERNQVELGQRFQTDEQRMTKKKNEEFSMIRFLQEKRFCPTKPKRWSARSDENPLRSRCRDVLANDKEFVALSCPKYKHVYLHFRTRCVCHRVTKRHVKGSSRNYADALGTISRSDRRRWNTDEYPKCGRSSPFRSRPSTNRRRSIPGRSDCRDVLRVSERFPVCASPTFWSCCRCHPRRSSRTSRWNSRPTLDSRTWTSSLRRVCVDPRLSPFRRRTPCTSCLSQCASSRWNWRTIRVLSVSSRVDRWWCPRCTLIYLDETNSMKTHVEVFSFSLPVEHEANSLPSGLHWISMIAPPWPVRTNQLKHWS